MEKTVNQSKNGDKTFTLNDGWLAGILGSAMDAIITVDEQQRILLFNTAAEKMFRCEATAVLGETLDRFIPSRHRESHLKHVRTFGETKVTQRQMGQLRPVSGLRADGEEFPVEASISQIEIEDRRLFTVIIRDITEKKRMESQFLRVQRMESIGTLAGGIAHDLNNVLSPILTATELLQMRTADESMLRLLNIIQSNALRGGEMIRQVLSFARGVEGDYVLLQPNHLVKEIIKILSETFPKNIEIGFSLAPGLWHVNGDTTQLHQVLMNLCVNARDSMPDGGKLRIETDNIVIDDHYVRMNVEAKPGSYVRLLVQDDGFGMAPEVIEKIFDPFFTTKKPGQGTGLGLSTVAGIMRSHGGFINVYSEQGKGSRFTIYLPANLIAEPEEHKVSRPDLPFGNGETILVVDDEESIREVAKETLVTFGYNVITANDGTEALARFAAHRDEIRLVITDMMMPYMDGPTMIRALRKMDSEVRVIATSGLKANSHQAEISQLGVGRFLTKPYTAETLLRAIASMLAEE